MRVRWFHSEGWFGLRLGRNYWIVRDTKRHPLRYTERNGVHTLRLASWRSWEFRVK